MSTICPQCKADISLHSSQSGLDLVCPFCKSKPSAGASPSTNPGDLTPGFEDDAAPSTSHPELAGMEEAIGKEFGEYEILSEIGRGAVGVVYRARHKQLRREVALKILLAGVYASQRQVERFYREAQAAAKLRHPNIVSIYDIGSRQGRHFYTMDFIHGNPLNKLVQEHAVTIRAALGIVIELSDALGYAHEQKVIHRDIKPGNIIVDKDGRPHLMDFGLAKQLDSETKFTQTGRPLGTPSYMSPEQAAGEIRQMDHRSDVYSLGTVLYELVTGRTPFEGDNLIEVVTRVRHHDPVPPRKINPTLHRDIQTIILKAMDKSPERRYQSMREFGDDLRRFLAGETILARPASAFTQTWRKLQKHTAAVVSISIALIIAGLSLIYAFAVTERLAKLMRETSQKVWKLEQERMEEMTQTKPQLVQVIEEDFSGSTLSARWEAIGDPKSWEVRNGELAVNGPGESAFLLVPNTPLHGNIKLNYRARISPGSDRFRIDCVMGPNLPDAFRLILEKSEAMPRLMLQRKGSTIAEMDLKSIEAGQSYEFFVQRNADQLRFEISNGQRTLGILRCTDISILRAMGAPGVGGFRLGLASWDTLAWFDSVRLEKEILPENLPRFYSAEQLILSMDYDAALKLLTRILDTSDEFDKIKALHLMGHCWELKGLLPKAIESYEQVNLPTNLMVPGHTREEWTKLDDENEVRKFSCYVGLGRLAEAAQALTRLSERGALIDGSSVWTFRYLIQRCLVTPNLSETLLVFQKARFSIDDLGDFEGERAAGALSLYELSRFIGQNLHSEFLQRALSLAIKFGQAPNPNPNGIMEVYRAFPAPEMAAAFDSGIWQALRLEKLDEAMALLKFASEKFPTNEKLDVWAEWLGSRFCQLQQYNRVRDVYESFPAGRLVVSYRVAVAGLIKQGRIEDAETLFLQAIEQFRKPPPEGKEAEDALESMAVGLMNAYAGTGDLEKVLNTLEKTARPSHLLADPVRSAISRAAGKADYTHATALLKAVQERSIPVDEPFLKETDRLADRLVSAAIAEMGASENDMGTLVRQAVKCSDFLIRNGRVETVVDHLHELEQKLPPDHPLLEQVLLRLKKLEPRPQRSAGKVEPPESGTSIQ